MTVEHMYEITGSDYNDVVRRLGGEALVRRFVLKFINDPSFAELKSALADGRIDDAFRAAHTLKGVAINLGFTALYKPSAELTEILRSGTFDGTEELFSSVSEEYTSLISAISELDA